MKALHVAPQACLLVAALLLSALPAAAQAQKKYTGPRPPKPDRPFLVHASKLIEVEQAEAQQNNPKDEIVYTVPGATSSTRTPVPEPIFLFEGGRFNPERLSLFRMEVKGGQRTLALPNRPGGKRRDSARPIFILVTPLDGKLFRVEVNEALDNGEYCLSPEGVNTTWCFTEY